MSALPIARGIGQMNSVIIKRELAAIAQLSRPAVMPPRSSRSRRSLLSPS